VGYDKDPAAALEAFNKLELFKNPSALRTYCSKVDVPKKVKIGKKVETGRKGEEGASDDDPEKLFLAKVDEVQAFEIKTGNKEITYGDALVLATERFPEESKAYEEYHQARLSGDA
jgi:hypothetical protein